MAHPLLLRVNPAVHVKRSTENDVQLITHLALLANDVVRRALAERDVATERVEGVGIERTEEAKAGEELFHRELLRWHPRRRRAAHERDELVPHVTEEEKRAFHFARNLHAHAFAEEDQLCVRHVPARPQVARRGLIGGMGIRGDAYGDVRDDCRSSRSLTKHRLLAKCLARTQHGNLGAVQGVEFHILVRALRASHGGPSRKDDAGAYG